MKLPALWVGMAMLGMVGCATTIKLPDIPNHHWRRNPDGATLYRNDGHESASFIGTLFGDSAQVCDFDSAQTCQYFESNQQALEWLRLQF